MLTDPITEIGVLVIEAVGIVEKTDGVYRRNAYQGECQFAEIGFNPLWIADGRYVVVFKSRQVIAISQSTILKAPMDSVDKPSLPGAVDKKLRGRHNSQAVVGKHLSKQLPNDIGAE